MGFGNLLKTVRKLNRMGRWANEYMTEDVRPTISSHSFTVTQAAQMLGTIEEKNGNTINWKQLYEKAINHDVKEALTGDILSHVKNHKDEIKTLIEEVENFLTEKNIFNKLPAEYVDDYRRILNNGKDETIEGKILEAADKIDCLIECVIEIRRNNPEEVFFETYVRYVNFLKDMNMISTKYFLQNALPELIENHTNLKRITKELLR
ncbi:MAG: putative metaldependent phosphohydrolase [Bacillales bacterium]|nr:putative metaldependent phosphohydrolase [Bacillales bacterium]